MIHIVFQSADVEVLKKAIDLDNSTNAKELSAALQGDVVEIKDDFAVGPIINIYEEDGYVQRRDWWKMLLEHSSYTESLDIVNDKLTVHQLIRKLKEDENEMAWIWMGQNSHDVCGYYWLISQLKEFMNRIYVLYLNNLPFINEKGGIFYPSALHEIQPVEFLKAKKLARKVTPSEFEVDGDEWTRLCNENATVRILEGGKKIVNKGEDYYDQQILNAVTVEQQKLPKILNTLFAKLKVKTGDVFLVWRMRKLIEEGKLNIGNDWQKGWKEVVLSKPALQVINEQ